MKINTKKTNNPVLLLIFLTMFTKVFGFMREIVFANYFGTSDLADVYKIIQAIPLMVMVFIGIGFNTGLIPIYNKVNSNGGKRKADEFLSDSLTLLLFISIIICIIIILFPKPIVWAFASGFNEEKTKLAIEMLRTAILSILFAILRYIYIPYLQINENFVIPAMIGIPSNIILISSFPAGYFLSFKYLSYGLILSELSQLLLVFYFAKVERFKYYFRINIFNNNIKDLFKISLPVIFSSAISQINILVDKNMASVVEPNGGVSALDYANRLNGFVQGIFIYSIVSVMYPKISKFFVKNQIKEMSQLISNSFLLITISVTPCMIGILLFSYDITKLIFQRGAFSERSVLLTSQAMFYYAISLLMYGFREILIRIFYTQNDSKTPTSNSIIAVILNIILNLILSPIFGLKGLAIATTTSNILCTILMFYSLNKKNIFVINSKYISKEIIKIFFSATIMGIFSYFADKYLKIFVSDNLALLIIIPISVLVYTASLLILKLNKNISLK